MPIEIHEVEITTEAAPARAAAPSGSAGSAPSGPPTAAAQSPQRRILAARLLDRELASRASRLRAD